MSGGLSVRDVSVVKSGKTIVSGASLTAPQGRVTGIVGPNGAGKSTLIEAIVGISPIAAGGIALGNAVLAQLDRRARARQCAYVAQSVSTEERLTVRDVVALGRIPHSSIWSSGPSREDETIVSAALNQVGLSQLSGRLFVSLSGGEQQRVQIARALAQRAPLLVLDEPTSHLDIRAQMEMLELLGGLTEGADNTVLVALHDLNLALRYCHWLVVMKAGQVVAEGEPTRVLTPALLAEVYGVRAAVSVSDGGYTIIYQSLL